MAEEIRRKTHAAPKNKVYQMIRFFRKSQEESSSGGTIKNLLFAVIIGLIVGSFLIQVSMGLCPVP